MSIHPKSIWQHTFVARSFQVDSSRRLSMHGLLSLLQESAWQHAAVLGHGFAQTRQSVGSWVLARQRAVMDRWPQWGQEFAIRTWLRPPGSVLVTRDFEILVDDEVWGRACAHWLTIDHSTRRPVPLPFPDDPSLFRQDFRLDFEPEKVAVFQPRAVLKIFEVYRSDLDMNGHVNNTRFSQWLLDSLANGGELREYQINFLAEAKLGDRVVVEGPVDLKEPTDDPISFQGVEQTGGKTLFTARLTFE